VRVVPHARLSRRTLVAAAATCLLIAIVFAVLVHAVVGLRSTSRWSDHSAQVLSASIAAEQALDDLTTAQSGYVYLHQPGMIGPFRRARALLPRRMRALERLVSDNPAQARRAHDLSLWIDDYVDTWATPLVGLAGREPEAAVRLGHTYGGTPRLSLIRSRFGTFNAVEQTLSSQRGAHARGASSDAIAAGVAVLIAVLALVLGFALYVVRTVVRPVRGLAQAAIAVGEGDLTARVPATGNDEVGDLGRAFNAMSAALERDRSQLADVTVRLARSNRDLEDFASVASHDLREPLRKIQTFADRLATGHGHELSEGGADYLARMQRSAARLEELIEDLLTLSRVSTEAKPFAPVDLADVGQDVVADLEVSIESAGATVELDGLPTLEADPVQMRQLLQNLIANAIKFRRPDVPPVVRVTAEPGRDGLCTLMVEDNGIGFDQRHAERIFGAFERLHGRSRYEGSGVGLAVCRKIAHRHGGEIAAVGIEGEGARFLVILPRTQALAA
jgi:signal transduction histidine kinase